MEFDPSCAQRLSCTAALITHISHCPLLLDGFTHWSLTGTLVTDEDTFMGFNDGLSQSGNQAGTCSAEAGKREGAATPACTYCSELFLKHEEFWNCLRKESSEKAGNVMLKE